VTRLTIRIDFGNGMALGPGKVRLLELVDESGSIREAARKMRMSYRQAWLLLRSLAETFGDPLVETATGGRAGGGAHLTALGRFVVTQYRTLEPAAAKAAAAPVAALAARAARGAASSAAKPGRKPIRPKASTLRGTRK
jgi:molybdate transport system regulatory protein